MKKRYISFLILILVFSIVVGAFYLFPKEKSYEDIVTHKDQVIRVQIANSPRTLDPQRAYFPEDLMLIANLQEGLLGITEEGAYTLGAGLSESYEVAEDGRIYRFYLREATWSNGIPITARDFYNGWKRALDLGEEAPYGHLLYNIKNAEKYKNEEVQEEELGMTILSDTVFEVELEKKDPHFLNQLIHPVFFPMQDTSKNLYDLKPDRIHENYITSGPFVMNEWVPYEGIRFSINPNYWDVENVKMEQIHFIIINEDQRIFEAFRGGEVDAIEVSEDYRAHIKKSPGFYSIKEEESNSEKEIKDFEIRSGQVEEDFRIGIIRPAIRNLRVLPYPIKYNFKWSYIHY